MDEDIRNTNDELERQGFLVIKDIEGKYRTFKPENIESITIREISP